LAITHWRHHQHHGTFLRLRVFDRDALGLHAAATAVGVSGKIAASPVCTISEILAELGMYSSTFGPMVVGQALKPGLDVLLVAALDAVEHQEAMQAEGLDAEADWNTTLPLYFGSARSIHEVGGAQPFSLNILVL
jgi:hypothetical protein